MMFRITAGKVFEEKEIVTLTSLAAFVAGMEKKWKIVRVSFAPAVNPHSYDGYITCSGAKS